jgi:hypothetical protein
MLTILGQRQRYCDGVNRHNFLKIGAFGAGLTLAGMLRAQAAATPTTTRKSAIMIYLPGGPSHMDMYDLKPEAPMEFRGEFKLPTSPACRFANTCRFRRRCGTSSPSSVRWCPSMNTAIRW